MPGNTPQFTVGQNWTDVTGSRAANTVYQNTTGKPITCRLHGSGFPVYVDSNVACTTICAGNSANTQVTFIVPPGYYYKAGDGTNNWIAGWWGELR